MKLTDTHCHILDEKYTQTKDELVAEWIENNGGEMFIVGTDVETSVEMVETAKKYNFVHAIIGIHPEYAKEATIENLQTIEKLAKEKSVVAIGEIGLDFYYGKENEKEQIEIFEKQMLIAQKLNKPVCIHSREAMAKTIEVLKKYPTVKGVVHCFGGSAESAKEIVGLGYLIGVGGILTFKNNVKLVEVVKVVGLENIVLETDSPYLCPEPKRGEVNKPHNVMYVAQKVAELLNVNYEKVLETTLKNAEKMYLN